MDYYDPSPLVFLVDGASACAGWIVGLLIAIAGFVSARGALPRAGYLVGASGLALFLRWCCIFGPSAAQRAASFWNETAFQLAGVASLMLRLTFAALFLAGAVILAREVKARRAGAGGA